MPILVYSYYSEPWLRSSGDEVRISYIIDQLIKKGIKTFVLVLSIRGNKALYVDDKGVAYLIHPRRIYKIISCLIRWKDHYDLNPLWKVTLYFDEFLISVMLMKFMITNGRRLSLTMYVFGSMSLLPWFLQILWNISHLKPLKIIYDPLSNYAQTLYLRSRRSFMQLIKYGIYLVLHKLSIHSSDVIVYPSIIDKENAEKMYKLRKGHKVFQIILNPSPICFESVNEYLRLRKTNREGHFPHFILLAGGRGEHNLDAVKMTLQAFKDLPPEKFRLFVTGPWIELRHLVRNPSIKFLGVVPLAYLKSLIASCDYGLSPVFSHSSGTSIKVITYLTGGLGIIGSPHSLAGIDLSMLKRAEKIYLVRDLNEYKSIIESIVNSKNYNFDMKNPRILLCNEHWRSLEGLA